MYLEKNTVVLELYYRSVSKQHLASMHEINLQWRAKIGRKGYQKMNPSWLVLDARQRSNKTVIFALS